DSIDDAIAAVNNLASGNKTKVKLTRDGQSKDVEVTVTKLPTNVPGELPAAVGPQPGDAKTAAAEAHDLKLPEFANKCRVYVPASHEAGQPQAAILWLQSSTEKPNDVITAWQSICDRDGIILIVPSPSGKDQWERPELEYLRRLSEHV